MLATLGVVCLIVGASAACAATHAPRYAATIEWLAGVLVIVGLAAIGGQLGAFVR